ncbi:MAG TPA: hypothetical protein VF550_03775 [Polyangia bacterium]
MRAGLALGVAMGGWLLGGCSSSTDAGSGREAFFRIQGAQYIPGPIDTSPRDDLPTVLNVATMNNDLFPGVSNKNISGTVGPESTAVLIGLQNDVGHWVVQVQDVADLSNLSAGLTFSCSASFSPLTPAGALNLVFRATTSRDGKVGPAKLQPLTMTAPQLLGALVISLDWDTQADLDLHVQIPSDGLDGGGATEIWSRKPSAVQPAPGTTATVQDGMQAGYLDYDSNSMCVIDGRRAENVIFPTAAPHGRYIVRVDTFSLCSEVTARWRLRVFANGGADPAFPPVFGQSTDIDTRFPHGQGQGAQALVFDN